MTQGQVMDILRGALVVALKLTMPMLIVSIVIGLISAIFQAATQIHEQTLSFVFKLTVVVTILLLNGGWMMDKLIEYTETLYTLIRS